MGMVQGQRGILSYYMLQNSSLPQQEPYEELCSSPLSIHAPSLCRNDILYLQE